MKYSCAKGWVLILSSGFTKVWELWNHKKIHSKTDSIFETLDMLWPMRYSQGYNVRFEHCFIDEDAMKQLKRSLLHELFS